VFERHDPSITDSEKYVHCRSPSYAELMST
jgi:hypothetical protein